VHSNKRYLKLLVIIFILVTVLPCAGFGASSVNPGEITASGTVRKQGITTYMYGTHVLLDGNGKTLYALKSVSVDLDRYIGRKVTVKGDLVKGYPVDFGPKFLNVESIE
jgi:hypothetical protein